MRTAIYARVSTKDGRQDSENQLRQLRAFAETQGWIVIHEYVDRASGKRSDREQFQRMFESASRREFDCLLFWSLDRLSREGTVETLNHLQRLTGYGVNYRSFTEQYLDSTGIFKEAVIGILAAVAKQERVRLSERTIVGVGGKIECAGGQHRHQARERTSRSEADRAGADIGRAIAVGVIENERASAVFGQHRRAVAAAVKKSPNTVLRLLLPAAEKRLGMP